jgi:hypothetical protein
MPGLSFRKIISLSELLNASLKPQLIDMPHLKQDSDNLDQLITNAKSLDQEQQSLTGRLREITRLRKEAEQNSNELRSRVAAQLRGKLGFSNENLLGYGIKAPWAGASAIVQRGGHSTPAEESLRGTEISLENRDRGSCGCGVAGGAGSGSAAVLHEMGRDGRGDQEGVARR